MKSSLVDIMRNRNFRLLWGGEGISLLGDQFSLIALPWLALKLTGSALAIGTILALAAIPRAVFMLLGGAFTDRFSPKTVMLWSNVIRLVLVAALALLTVTGAVQLWMVYVFALLFGLADAFFFPAQAAMVPRLLGAERLQVGNALIQGTGQLSVFLGPVLAGVLIALLDGGGSGAAAVPDMWGIGVAFAFDAVTFLVSALTLAAIKLPAVAAGQNEQTAGSGMFSSIAETLTTVWRDRGMRYYFLIIAAINLLMTGPLAVGIPVLADTRFKGGAAAFGIIMSCFGGGSLVGVIAAGALKRPPARRFPFVMLIPTVVAGLGLALLGLLSSIPAAAAVAVVVGVAGGYVQIQFITWLQLRTPAQMLGRIMSVLMFSVFGLGPLSNTIAGALIEWNATAVMVGAGVMMAAVAALTGLSPSIRGLDAEPETECALVVVPK